MRDSVVLVDYRGGRSVTRNDAFEVPHPASPRAPGHWNADAWAAAIAGRASEHPGRCLALAGGSACLALLRALTLGRGSIVGALFVRPATLYAAPPETPLPIPSIVIGPRSAGGTGLPAAGSFARVIGAHYVEADEASSAVSLDWLARPYSAILVGRLAWTVDLYDVRRRAHARGRHRDAKPGAGRTPA